MATDRQLGRVLGWPYAGPALVAVAWALTLFTAPTSTGNGLVIALLCGYRLADLTATLIDLRPQPRGAAVTERLGNAAVDAVAAIAILMVARDGSDGFCAVYRPSARTGRRTSGLAAALTVDLRPSIAHVAAGPWRGPHMDRWLSGQL